MTETVTFYSYSYLIEPLLHSNFNKCMSGRIICVGQIATIESCNIFNNTVMNYEYELMGDEAAITLSACVVAFNTHPKLNCCTKVIAVNCLFCRNGFIYEGGDLCVPTLRLTLIDGHSCKGGSDNFTDQSTFSNPLIIIFPLLLK